MCKKEKNVENFMTVSRSAVGRTLSSPQDGTEARDNVIRADDPGSPLFIIALMINGMI